MNPLNLLYVKYFCDAVKFGSIVGAAKANFVTPSAISQGITKLEQTLKVSLLAHYPNRFRTTPEGENLFPSFINLLRNSDEIQSKISDGKIDDMGDLVFSSSYSFAFAAIPKYLKRFITEHPRIKIKFILSPPDTIKEDVKNGKIDFGILPNEGDLANFNKKTVYSGGFRLYTAMGDQKKGDKNCKFILTEHSSKETISLKKSYNKRFRRELVNSIEVDSWEMIANLVSQGIGVGYLPDYFIKERSDLLIQEYQLGLKMEEYQMVAISSKGMKLRKSSELFLSYF